MNISQHRKKYLKVNHITNRLRSLVNEHLPTIISKDIQLTVKRDYVGTPSFGYVKIDGPYDFNESHIADVSLLTINIDASIAKFDNHIFDVETFLDQIILHEIAHVIAVLCGQGLHDHDNEVFLQACESVGCTEPGEGSDGPELRDPTSDLEPDNVPDYKFFQHLMFSHEIISGVRWTCLTKPARSVVTSRK